MARNLQDNIRILPAHSIDKLRWDACIQADGNALIYSTSWYLDHMADEWSGLVLNDYQAVMPLPTKTKWSIGMIYMPPFTQRLGLSGTYSPAQKTAIINTVLKHKRLIQYSTTDSNLFIGTHFGTAPANAEINPTSNSILTLPNTTTRPRTNFILPLQDSYPNIAASYTTPCQKNIKKARTRGCTITSAITIPDVIKRYTQAYGTKASYTEDHFKALKQLLEYAHRHSKCHIAGVIDEATGELIYAGVLLNDGKRLYYLLGAPTDKGRQMRATYFFIDEMIRTFAGQPLIFDFEGSDIPEVATFYRSFSPKKEDYFQYYINQYPFPLNKLLDTRLKPF